MLLLMALMVHVVVETAVQLFFAERSGVGRELADFRAKAGNAGLTLEQFGKQADLDPYLGWGGNEARIHEPPPGTPASATLLFVGDSVTAGHEVRAGEEDYPARLAALLGDRGVRVVNLAARGYGVDQMWLKLLTRAAAYHPSVVVFAYIPHDLIRPAKDFNFGLPKPKYRVSGSRLDLALAPGIADYVGTYESARGHFVLSDWFAAHFWMNREYQLPALYFGYYQRIYRHIGEGLAKLSEEWGIPVRVVKLSNRKRFSGSERLTALAASEWIRPTVWSKADVRYMDTEECVTAKAKERGVDMEREFAHHPGPVGHRLLAECLAAEMETLLPRR